MTVTEKIHSRLFTPLKIGNITLKHRVIMAPLTRARSPEHIPTDIVTLYYSQRASEGGLLISEGTHPSVMGGNFENVPGIFTPEQRRAWKKVTDGVHAKGGYIFCQLWHVGRTTHPSVLGGRKPLGPSANILEGGVAYFCRDVTGGNKMVIPRAMTKQDMEDTVEDLVHAAKTAIDAGFDGVEIHAANGYLLDEFLADNINQRTDEYGGSPENRSRFVLEVVDAVAAAIGADRTGIRLSPFNTYQDPDHSDIIGQFSDTVASLDNRGLAYIHLVRERSKLIWDDTAQRAKQYAAARLRGVPENRLSEQMTLKPLKKLIQNTPVIVCGEFDGSNVWDPIDAGQVDAAVYGKYFISNPDLVERLKHGWKLAEPNMKLAYSHEAEGYIDYPTYQEELKSAKI